MGTGLRSGLLAACVLFGTAALASTVGEKIDSAVDAASSVAARTGAAIEHGAQAAASGAVRGVKAGASAVKRGAKAAASGVERGASWAAGGIEKGAKAAQRGASAAAAKVGIGGSDEPKKPAPVETVRPKPIRND